MQRPWSNKLKRPSEINVEAVLGGLNFKNFLRRPTIVGEIFKNPSDKTLCHDACILDHSFLVFSSMTNFVWNILTDAFQSYSFKSVLIFKTFFFLKSEKLKSFFLTKRNTEGKEYRNPR